MKNVLQTLGLIRAVDEEALTVDAVISTGDLARDDAIIETRGWQLGNFRKNPVVLWNHQSMSPPIARATTITKGPEELTATARFDAEDPTAMEIFGKIIRGFINATSVRWLPILTEVREPENEGDRPILWFRKQELLEFSFVTIPVDVGAKIKRGADGETYDPDALAAALMQTRIETVEGSSLVTARFVTDLEAGVYERGTEDDTPEEGSWQIPWERVDDTPAESPPAPDPAGVPPGGDPPPDPPANPGDGDAPPAGETPPATGTELPAAGEPQTPAEVMLNELVERTEAPLQTRIEELEARLEAYEPSSESYELTCRNVLTRENDEGVAEEQPCTGTMTVRADATEATCPVCSRQYDILVVTEVTTETVVEEPCSRCELPMEPAEDAPRPLVCGNCLQEPPANDSRVVTPEFDAERARALYTRLEAMVNDAPPRQRLDDDERREVHDLAVLIGDALGFDVEATERELETAGTRTWRVLARFTNLAKSGEDPDDIVVATLARALGHTDDEIRDALKEAS